MKSRLWLLLVIAFGCLAPCGARADALFRLFWRVTYYTRNSTGHIVSAPFSETDFVREVAQNAGIDPSQLILVYRPNKRDAAVVRRNGAFVASVIQMQSTYTDVVNPIGSAIVRHALLGDDSQSDPLGSFFGMELRTLNSNGALLNDNLVGTVVYSRGGVVFSGRVTTGGRVSDATQAP